MDETPVLSSKISGWVKTLVGTLAAALSGAVMMWVSPLLQNAFRPARPIANFQIDAQNGLEVTFKNLSSGGDGWWDFGDGTALEPASLKQPQAKHTYPSAGTYVAKLTVRSLLGDESDRTVNIQLGDQRSDPPEILALDATPISPGAFAPATFRITTKCKNAKVCVWDYGDDRPDDVVTEMPDNQDRLVTFPKPGGYMVKVVAVNGTQFREQNTVVFVDEPPTGMVTAILHVADQATRVDRADDPVTVTVAIPPYVKDNVYAFDQPVPAKPGYEIVAARYETVNERGAEGVTLQVSDDHRSAHLTGKLVHQGGLLQLGSAPAGLLARVLLTQEIRTPASRPSIPITIAMSTPGSALLPLPALPENWVNAQRDLRLELHEGDRVAWHESQLPRKVPVTLKNHQYALTATQVGNQVRVEVADLPAAGSVSGN